MPDYTPPAKAHYHFVKERKNHLASIVKIPPAVQADVDYKDLVFTEQDRANIKELVSTMAHNNKLQLAFKTSHLKKIGAQIGHVHPLKFLSTIFSDPELKEAMGSIRDDHYKWSELVTKGVGPGLTREGTKGKLELYLNDFANEISMSPDEIRPYFQSHEWEDFVVFLMQ